MAEAVVVAAGAIPAEGAEAGAAEAAKPMAAAEGRAEVVAEGAARASPCWSQAPQ